MFFLGGPNTLLGHGGSYVTIAEMQMDYVVDLLASMVRENVASVECREDVCRDYVAAVDAAHAKMVWTHPAMDNWYRNENGRVTAVLPWRIVDYRAMVRHADLADYKITHRAERVARSS
jgi:4-hydroxyacetophenone monooxygenase